MRRGDCSEQHTASSAFRKVPTERRRRQCLLPLRRLRTENENLLLQLPLLRGVEEPASMLCQVRVQYSIASRADAARADACGHRDALDCMT